MSIYLVRLFVSKFVMPQGLAFSHGGVSKTVLLMTTTGIVMKSIGPVIYDRLTPETGCTDYPGIEPP